MRPKRYFCRRCFPHLHFTSELDKKAHIDAFHDGRARDRVIAPSGGGGSSAGVGTPTGEGKRKERADGEGGEEGGGSERKKSRSSAGGVKAESSSMRGTPTHAGHISLGHSAPMQAQDLLTQQQGQGQYVPVAPPFWMGQPYPPVGMPYGYPYPPPPQQQGSISPYPPSSMPPPPPPPSMHPHRTSSSMLAPPPPPAHQHGRRKSRAGGPTHQQDESIPSEVRELKPFACAFCISDPRVDFSTQGELEEHVRTSHDWRVVERARLVGREQEEQDSPEGEEKDKAGEEGAGKGDGWCAFCVPGVNMGGGLKWHVMVAHQRLKGPPTETFKIAQGASSLPLPVAFLFWLLGFSDRAYPPFGLCRPLPGIQLYECARCRGDFLDLDGDRPRFHSHRTTDRSSLISPRVGHCFFRRRRSLHAGESRPTPPARRSSSVEESERDAPPSEPDGGRPTSSVSCSAEGGTAGERVGRNGGGYGWG